MSVDNILNISIDEALPDYTPTSSTNIDLTECVIDCNDIMDQCGYSDDDIKSQKRIMADVVTMISDMTNFTNAFLNESNHSAEYYFKNFNFDFVNKIIKIEMFFETNDFDITAYLQMFTEGYYKQFDDFSFEFIIDTE